MAVNLLSAIREGFSRWIDSVVDFCVALLDRFSPPRLVTLVEDRSGEFALHSEDTTASKRGHRDNVRFVQGRMVGGTSNLKTIMSGARAELFLQPDQFLIQPLELPRRASEFLDGIVRAQIDQLTPWAAADAAFGWSGPTDAGADRITVTVVATARSFISPYVSGLREIGVRSIAIFTGIGQTGPNAMRIKVLQESVAGILDMDRIRRALVTVFLTSAFAAVAALIGSAIMGASLESEQAELSAQIARARTAATALRDTAAGPRMTGLESLMWRKHAESPAVIVLDLLAQILPDHTYITELHIDGDKLQLIGVTRDAPSLIGLIEQSGRFTRATFFAPTTRSGSDPSERFHIETHIKPVASQQS